VYAASQHQYPELTMSNISGWYSQVTEGKTGKLIHGLIEAAPFYVSYIALWKQNGSFQTLQSC